MSDDAEIEVQLAHLAVHAVTREPLALLADDQGRCLVVSVRQDPAQVIALGARPARDDDTRLTQDVVADVLDALGRHVECALIADLVDGRFAAALVLDDGTRVTVRPSDALSLAVRDGRPIRVSATVLDEAGQPMDEIRPADKPPEPYEQVQQMRDFLDDVTADDFGRADGGPAAPESGGGP